MSATLQVSGLRDLSAGMRFMVDALEGEGRAELNRAMGVEVQNLTQAHLLEIAPSRHKTAEGLGADPSGHLEQAAEKAAAPGALTSDSMEAVLAFNHPGMSRALHDIDIEPLTGDFLTIPVSAEAYAHRAREFDLKIVYLRDPWVLVPKDAELPKRPWGMAELMQIRSLAFYLLLKSVHQAQDPTLLPTHEQFEDAARTGAVGYIKLQSAKAGKLS